MVLNNSNRVEYPIFIDWTRDYLLLNAVQRSIDSFLHSARSLKLRNVSIKYELVDLRELLSIKRQIINHVGLSSVYQAHLSA